MIIVRSFGMKFLVLTICLNAAMTACGAGVAFTQKPSVSVEHGKVKITFALSAPTDVAVGIVNEKGNVVKHIAGGMLGDKAPKPLKPGSVSQTLRWDRTDDLGKPVPGGKYRIEVQAGMKPVFDRIMCREPRAVSDIFGMAVGPAGELFLINSAGRWVENFKPAREIRVFSRDCKYLRTILPYPGDLPYEQIKGVNPIKRADGTYIPKLYRACGHLNYPDLSGRPSRQTMAVTPGGDLLFVGRAGRTPRRLLRIRAADGAIPEPFDVVEFPVKGGYGKGWPQLALSRDGRHVYAGGFFTEDIKKKGILDHAVYRWEIGSEKAEIFAGEPLKAGNSKDLFNQVHGVAVDGEGNVLVSDFGNDRIVVLSQAGKHIGEFKVDWPDHICVHRGRGTVYVISVDKSNKDRGGRILWKKKTLFKFRSWKDPKVLGKMSLAARGNYYSKPLMALDDTADPPILWIGNYRKWELSCIKDADPEGKLPKTPETAISAAKFGNMPASVEHLTVDPVNERLYVREYCNGQRTIGWRAFDGKTGEPVKLAGTMDGVDMQVGLDGSLYTYKHMRNWRKYKTGGAWILRWDRDGNPLAFEGSESHVSEIVPYGDRTPKARFVNKEGCHGFGVGPSGEAYVIYGTENRGFSDPMWVCVVGRDGKIRKEKLLGLTTASCSPQIDRDGNIYVMDSVIPEGKPVVPPHFAGAAKERRSQYPRTFGSIVRFPPAGGGVYHEKLKGKEPALDKPVGKVVECWGGGGRVLLDNADWVRPYASPVPAQRGVCICIMARMSLDRYGRIFAPETASRRINVLDTEGNHICSFGRYGNPDNGGEDNLRPIEGIPLNWAYCVAASDRAVYISDLNNSQVVRVELDYETEARCPIP